MISSLIALAVNAKYCHFASGAPKISQYYITCQLNKVDDTPIFMYVIQDYYMWIVVNIIGDLFHLHTLCYYLLNESFIR